MKLRAKKAHVLGLIQVWSDLRTVKTGGRSDTKSQKKKER